MTLEIEILQFLHYHPLSSRAEIESGVTNPPSPATIKRLLTDAVRKGRIEVSGRGPATRYRLTPQAHVTFSLYP
jgi:DNA-binding PadR family transcriptional regulator